jgi:hypothetical protein
LRAASSSATVRRDTIDGKNAEFVDPKKYAQLVIDHDRVVTF